MILWRGGLSPLGCAAALKTVIASFWKVAVTLLGPLRSPTGASPLATGDLTSIRGWVDAHEGPCVTPVEPVPPFALLFTCKACLSNGCFQVIALANDRTRLRP